MKFKVRLSYGLIVILLSFFNNEGFTKEPYPSLYTFGYVQFNDNVFSQQVMEQRQGIMISGIFYFNNHMFMRTSGVRTRPILKETVMIEDEEFRRGEEFTFSSFEISLGYTLDLLRVFQVSAYSGFTMHEIRLEEMDTYRTPTGIPLGVNLNLMIDLTRESKNFLVFYFNNSINYSRLYKLNDKFGKGYYLYEFGVGFQYTIDKG